MILGITQNELDDLYMYHVSTVATLLTMVKKAWSSLHDRTHAARMAIGCLARSSRRTLSPHPPEVVPVLEAMT